MGQHINCRYSFDDFFDAQVIFFLAPYMSDNIRGQIAIYYYNRNFKYGDTLVMREEKTTGPQVASYYYYTLTPNGIINTKIIPQQLSQSANPNYEPECLGYAGSWIRDGVNMTESCLSTHPDWMYKHRDIIKNRELMSLMIPGTHNSGSYSNSLPQTMIEKFAVTQDKDILQQLISGARYLDLRPCKHDEYWICHGSFFMNPLKKIIDDIKEFMKNTQEIVILSFKEFPIGFNQDSDHTDFMVYLEREFSQYILPKSVHLYSILLRDIWKSGKRLIISYTHKIAKYNPNIWPSIPQMWGNIQPHGDLKAFLHSVEANPILPRATMAEITFDTWTVIVHSLADLIHVNHISLMKMASTVGPNVTQWYNEIFYRNASIVAVDYMDATGIVDVAIHWNLRRSYRCYWNYTSTT